MGTTVVVGAKLGTFVGCVGTALGKDDGTMLGCKDAVGRSVGCPEGGRVGSRVGICVGNMVGSGDRLGSGDGICHGPSVITVGDREGLAVGEPPPAPAAVRRRGERTPDARHAHEHSKAANKRRRRTKHEGTNI